VAKHMISRRFEWDAAHRVTKHGGKCRNLHGHRYAAEVYVASDDLDNVDRVVDFSVLKDLVGGWIDEKWDHGCVLCFEDLCLIDLCRRQGWKVHVLGYEPTAECLARELHQVAATLLESKGLYVVSVDLWETPNCKSTYPVPHDIT